MKYLIIAGAFAIVSILLYLRLRPYILTARRIFGVAREVRRVSRRNSDSAQPLHRASEAGRLIRCASCGTWIPQPRAVKLRAAASAYCSHACLERAASVDKSQKAAGGG